MEKEKYQELQIASKLVCEQCVGGDCDQCPVERTLKMLHPPVEKKTQYYDAHIFVYHNRAWSLMDYDTPLKQSHMSSSEADNFLAGCIYQRPFAGNENIVKIVVDLMNPTGCFVSRYCSLEY